MRQLLRYLSLTLVLTWGGGAVVAQDKNADIKQHDSVPSNTGRSKPEQNATQEPSSKVPGTDANATVFVNGVLAVPGALTDVDTAPAKFSARTATDDQLPIAGYRLKHLTAEQRAAIHAQLVKNPSKSGSLANGQHELQVGAEVPATTTLQDLQPMPDDIANTIPEVKGLSFLMIGEKAVLVDPTMRIVVAVFI